MEPEPKRPPLQFSLAGLLAVVLVVTVGIALASLLTVALADARKRSKVSDCKCGVKCLGVYLNTYVSRYGSDVHYPTPRPPPGISAAAIPGGTNGAFWCQLWLMPLAGGAVSRRPGDDGMYRCKVRGGPATATCLDYAGPNFADAAAFPGGRLSDQVAAGTFIGGDLLLPGDCNHGGDVAGPNYDYNALRFDGGLQSITPCGAAAGSEDRRYRSETDALTGVRTP